MRDFAERAKVLAPKLDDDFIAGAIGIPSLSIRQRSVASRFSKSQETDLRKALMRLQTLAGRMHGYFGNTRETAAVRAHITLIEHELAPRPSFESLISQAETVSAPLERFIEGFRS